MNNAGYAFATKMSPWWGWSLGTRCLLVSAPFHFAQDKLLKEISKKKTTTKDLPHPAGSRYRVYILQLFLPRGEGELDQSPSPPGRGI